MHIRVSSVTFAAVLGTIVTLPGSVGEATLSAAFVPPSSDAVVRQMSAMPLSFTKNEGQWDERVLFRTSAGGATIWLTRDGITYQFIRRVSREDADLSKRDGFPVPHGKREGRKLSETEPESIEQAVVHARFTGANPDLQIDAEGVLDYKCNYFLGNDTSQWRTDVPNCTAVVYRDAYPGIDLRLQGAGGLLTTAWTARDGADLSQVGFHYDGNASVTETEAGELLIEAPWGLLLQTSPTAREEVSTAGVASTVRAASAQTGASSVTLVYSTYLGGGSFEDGWGIAVDVNGSAYVTGYTESADFPTAGPYQTDQGGIDAFVTKLSASGSALVYSTYLGGGDNDYGLGIAVDLNGSAYVTGYTWSTDFPTAGPYQTDQGVWDAFVTKLSSAGNALVYSTYLGGGNYDVGNGISVDVNGSAYVTGFTSSTDFPTAGPYQTDQGGHDAFVTKLSAAGSALVYSTYLGGGNDDYGYGIAVDVNGSAYVTGGTYSTDFPTAGPYQTDQGGHDAFVTKLSAAGNALVYSTYLGGSGSEFDHGIAVDVNGSAYVTGWTGSNDFPTAGPYQTYQGHGDAFVTKLSAAGNALVYSTYLGGGTADYGYGIAVDAGGSAYVTGRTASADFPTVGPYQTDQGGYNDYDAFVTKLSAAGNALVYSTYLGGGGDDHGRGIAVDVNGSAYVTGRTYSTDFPTAGPYQTVQGGGDAFVTKLGFSGGCGFVTPPPPVVTNLQDPGTGHDLVVDWTHADQSCVTDFEVAWGTSPGDYSTGSMFVSADPSGQYQRVISQNVSQHTLYYVGVRSRNDAAGLWSDYAVAGPVRPTVPVVLIHGLKSSPEIWDNPGAADDYLAWLSAAGLNHVWIADNIEPCGVEDEVHFGGNALNLATFIENRIASVRDQTGVDIPAINIVGHSMGGLIARRYLSVTSGGDCPSSTWPARQVHNLVMLGTPNGGSTLASLIGWFYCRPATSEMTFRKMREFNACYNSHPGTTYFVVPGWGGHLSQETCLSLFENPCCDLFGSASIEDCPNDGVVSVASVRSVDFAAQRYDGWCHGSRSLLECLVAKSSAVQTYYNDFDLVDEFVRPILIGETVVVQEEMIAASPDSVTPSQIFVTLCDSTTSGSETVSPFLAESGAARISVFTSSPEVMVSLVSPGGFTWDSSSAETDPSVTYSSFDGGVGFAFEGMEAGTWNLRLDGSMLVDPWGYACMAGVSSNGVVGYATLSEEQLSPGGSGQVFLSVTAEGSPVLDANAIALVSYDEVSPPDTILLSDDGLQGDGLAMDGIYTGSFDAGPGGAIDIRVLASGDAPNASYTRILLLSAYTTVQCACDCHADPICDAVVNVFDVVIAVDVAFRAGTPVVDPNPACPREDTDVTCDNVTNVFDVVKFVDVAFRAGNPATAFCDPCG